MPVGHSFHLTTTLSPDDAVLHAHPAAGRRPPRSSGMQCCRWPPCAALTWTKRRERSPAWGPACSRRGGGMFAVSCICRSLKTATLMEQQVPPHLPTTHWLLPACCCCAGCAQPWRGGGRVPAGDWRRAGAARVRCFGRHCCPPAPSAAIGLLASCASWMLCVTTVRAAGLPTVPTASASVTLTLPCCPAGSASAAAAPLRPPLLPGGGQACGAAAGPAAGPRPHRHRGSALL